MNRILLLLLTACGTSAPPAPAPAPEPVAAAPVDRIDAPGSRGALATGSSATLPADFPLPALSKWPPTMVLGTPDTMLVSLTPPDGDATAVVEGALQALGCAPTRTVVSRMTVLACDAVAGLSNIQVTLLQGPPAKATVAYQRSP